MTKSSLATIDRAPPKRPVLVCPGRDQAEPVSRAMTDWGRADVSDCSRIDLFLVPVAIDDRPGDVLDDRAKARGDGSPAEPVDKRILEQFQ